MSDQTSSNASIPAWDDVDAWRARFARAEGLEARRAVATQRIEAAGGRVEGHSFTLPPDVRPCLGLAELRAYGGMVGLEETAP